LRPEESEELEVKGNKVYNPVVKWEKQKHHEQRKLFSKAKCWFHPYRRKIISGLVHREENNFTFDP